MQGKGAGAVFCKKSPYAREKQGTDGGIEKIFLIIWRKKVDKERVLWLYYSQSEPKRPKGSSRKCIVNIRGSVEPGDAYHNVNGYETFDAEYTDGCISVLRVSFYMP